MALWPLRGQMLDVLMGGGQGIYYLFGDLGYRG